MSRVLIALWMISAALATHAQDRSRFLKEESKCEVRVRLQEGWVCGIHRLAENRTHFVSFLGLPYAEQPVGVRRFSELEPVEPWDCFYDASFEGPACPQHNTFYGPLLGSTNMSEACIYANVHVPLHVLPEYKVLRPARHLQPPYETGLVDGADTGLPILVFIHGGGFAFGSGSTGLYGPEYLVQKDMIVITFNYRINVFGFLSLNSSTIPGNNGLRDIITLLKWVQTNAKAFGGNPNDVTLGGQSAGASSAHLLSMSPAAEGLFKRVILMSGTGIPTFFTTSPAYAKFVANLFLSGLGINATNSEDIHEQLMAMPLEYIMEANKQIQDKFGLVAFLPVVESPFPEFTTVLDNDPEVLLSKGSGKNIPLMIGFTNAECESFRNTFENIDMLGQIEKNPLLILSPNVIYKLPIEMAFEAAQKVVNRYLNKDPSMEKYIKSCSETFYVYPAMKLAKARAVTGGAPVFLYQYSYEADFSVIKASKGLRFDGAGHVEDTTFIFKANAMDGVKGFSPPTRKDQLMIDWMTMFVKNFIDCDDPTCNQRQLSNWPAASESLPTQYQYIEAPMLYRFMEPTNDQLEMIQFFDNLINVFGFLSLNSSTIPGNNGLRDIITLLKWVQTNAKAFGGNPNDVTLGGQSAGASSAHLLSMSPAAEGLFKRVILMSGTGIPTFFTTSPAYAKFVANLFLSGLGINATNSEDIHEQLIAMPLEYIMEANKQIQDKFGLVAFLPVVESPFPEFTTVLDNDPEVLLSKGSGKNIPLMIGFTNAECESFRNTFENIDMLGQIEKNPLLILSPNVIYKLPIEMAFEAAQKVVNRYLNKDPSMEKYIKSCSETFYVYPAMKLAKARAVTGGAPVFLYQYSYEADFSVIKASKGLRFDGAGHVEDTTFIFKANAMDGVKGFSPPTRKDQLMIDWMTMFVKNFLDCDDPTCNQRQLSNWPAASESLPTQYQYIEAPMLYRFMEPTKDQLEMIQFFDNL